MHHTNGLKASAYRDHQTEISDEMHGAYPQTALRAFRLYCLLTGSPPLKRVSQPSQWLFLLAYISSFRCLCSPVISVSHGVHCCESLFCTRCACFTHH